MSEHKTLAAALAAFQAEMPTVHKGKTAKVPTKAGGSYSYDYADLADMAQQIHPLLASHGLAFTTLPRATDSGSSYELLARLMHTSGESIEGALPIRGGSPQEWGSALTYMRRYLLGCLTGVVTDADDDGQAAAQGAQRRQQQAQRQEAKREARRPAPAPQQDTGEAVSTKTRGRLFALMGELVGTDEDAQRAFLTDTLGRDVESRATLTEAEAIRAGQRLSAWKRGDESAKWVPA